MPVPDSWDLCIGQGASAHSCCVHVGPVKVGPEGPFKAFTCCWCGDSIAFPMSPVPPLPPPAGPGVRHGPAAGGDRVARLEDLKL